MNSANEPLPGLGASGAQLLAGVARPGLGKGLVDDFRDSLRELLWHARVEGGRFRFTTGPNLNKVILEREGAISDDRVAAAIYDALRQVAPGLLVCAFTRSEAA